MTPAEFSLPQSTSLVAATLRPVVPALPVLFQTMPVDAYWDLSKHPYYKIDGPAFYIATAVITIITDFLVLMIPFWIFLGLKMRLAAKLGVIFIFLMGGVYVLRTPPPLLSNCESCALCDRWKT